MLTHAQSTDVCFWYICWLENGGVTKQRRISLDDGVNLIYSFVEEQGTGSNQRELLWDFSAFLAEKELFNVEPTVCEVQNWINGFFATEDNKRFLPKAR